MNARVSWADPEGPAGAVSFVDVGDVSNVSLGERREFEASFPDVNVPVSSVGAGLYDHSLGRISPHRSHRSEVPGVLCWGWI